MQRKVLMIASMLVFCFTTSGCSLLTAYGKLHSQAEKDYSAGDYDEAVRKLVAALKDNPDYEPSKNFLQTVAPQAYDRHLKTIEGQEQSRDWNGAVSQYDALSSLASLVASIPGNYPTINVKERRAEAARNAAEGHYTQAVAFGKRDQWESAANEFLRATEFVRDFKDARTQSAEAYYKHGTSLSKAEKFKEAAVAFRRSNEVVSGYRDAARLYEEMKAKGVKRVAILPFEGSARHDIGGSFADRVVSDAMANNPEFIQFVTRQHLLQVVGEQGLQANTDLVDPATATKVGRLAGIHAIVVGKVLSVVPVSSPEEASTYTNTIERFIPGNKKKGIPDQRVPLSVRYTVHKKKNSATVAASFQIIDVKTGAIKHAQTINAQREDATKWVTFIGEQDAIPAEALQGTTGEKRDPEPVSTLLESAVNSLSRDLARNLTDYFK